MLPSWFTRSFLAVVILIVIPMLTIWPLKVLGQKETPRPILEISEEPLSPRACRDHLSVLLEQLEDYTGNTSRTARNQGGELWLETMRAWQSDVERVAARCSLRPLASDADASHQALAKAYTTMLELSNVYISSFEPLQKESSALIKTAREAIQGSL